MPKARRVRSKAGPYALTIKKNGVPPSEDVALACWRHETGSTVPSDAAHRADGGWHASYSGALLLSGKRRAARPFPRDRPISLSGTGVRRRDFIEIAAVSAAGVGGLAVLYPLISQMAPSQDVLAESTTEIDLSAIETGQAIKAVFRKQPVFVRNLTEREIAEADAVPLSELRDPATLAERTKEGRVNWLITMGVCTHLGCVPLGTKAGDPKGDYDGWFCPCHGSHYDSSGRIRRGPAPANLAVPQYSFIEDQKIRIG